MRRGRGRADVSMAGGLWSNLKPSKTQCANAQKNCPAPHLAAWMTAPSRTLEKEPILIVFRSPRRTAPCQTDTCCDRKRASI